MKKQLINTFSFEIGGIEQICVNARELHAFLEVGKFFPNWIKQRIDECGYKENQDFRIFCQNWQKINPDSINRNDQSSATPAEGFGRGRPAKEYIITLDMAKELCMIERNPKGRIARRYFIQCERQMYKLQDAVLGLSQLIPEDIRTVLYFRALGLTRQEAARAFEVPEKRIEKVEEMLREYGLNTPYVNVAKRQGIIRRTFPKLIKHMDADSYSRLVFRPKEPALAKNDHKEALPC